MPTMCRLVTLLTLASAVSRSVAYEEPDCPLQNVVHFAESSDFDPNLPLTFGGGIVLEMTLTTPKKYSYKARVFSFSNYGEDVVSMSTGRSGYLLFGTSRGSGRWLRLKASNSYNGKTFTVRAVILPGITADSTKGKCFLYINGTLSSSGDCPVPTFLERRANFIGYGLSHNPTFNGTVTSFTLKACKVTASVPTPLPSPQCVLQNVVHFAESSDFDPNLPLTFGGGIVIEMTLTTPSTYLYGARLFSFSNYGRDVVRMNVMFGGAIFFGTSRGFGKVSGGRSRPGFNGKTFTVRAVILPGSTSDSTTGQCLLYVNGILSAYGVCPVPTFVERRANFIGYDLSHNPTFQGTVANFTLKACKVTPSVPTPLPSPQCVLQTVVDFAESRDFDPNLPLTFGGGIVIEVTLTTPNRPSGRRTQAAVFGSSNKGQDVVRMGVEPLGHLAFAVNRGSEKWWILETSSGFNGKTFTVRVVILPGSTSDSTTGQCLLYVNGTLNAYGVCPLPTFVERRRNYVGHDKSFIHVPFEGTVSNFTLKTCNATASVPTPLPSPQCPLQNVVHFAESRDFDPNLPLTFGGGIVIEMTLTTPGTSSYEADVFSSSTNGQDVVRMSVQFGKIYFGVSRGSGDVKGITSRDRYNGKTFTVRAVIFTGSTADSTTGKCLLYINTVLQAVYSSCQIPRWVERTTNTVVNDTSKGIVADFSMRSCNESLYTPQPATAVPDTALPDTLAPDTSAPPPRTAHPVPPGDSAAPMVPTAGPKGVVTAPTAVPTALHTVVPTPLRTSAPTALNNATDFDETDAPTTAAPEKDDSGTPGWVWVMVGLGAVVVLVVGGVLVWFFRHGNAMSRCTFDEFIQAEADLGVSELLNSGVEDPSTVHL